MEGNCEGKLLLRERKKKKEQPERMVSHNVNGVTFRRTVQFFQKQNTQKNLIYSREQGPLFFLMYLLEIIGLADFGEKP